MAAERIEKERKEWRKDHPAGFTAKPLTKPDGSNDLMHWEAWIPGKPGTIWEGGFFKLTLDYSTQYPAIPPRVRFNPPIFHVNVFSSGDICLSILDESKEWAPAMRLPDILLGVQALLTEPNTRSPANGEAAKLYDYQRAEYERRVKEMVKRMPAPQ